MRSALFAIAILMLSTNAYAITVGGIASKSKYGERLYLKIEVFETHSVGVEDVAFKVVSKNDHKIKTTREDELGEISLGLIMSDGLAWLVVRSEKIIYRGIVDLVIELSWPGGKTRRRYETRLYGAFQTPEQDSECAFGGRWLTCI